jgi:hypothetical protein
LIDFTKAFALATFSGNKDSFGRLAATSFIKASFSTSVNLDD